MEDYKENIKQSCEELAKLLGNIYPILYQLIIELSKEKFEQNPNIFDNTDANKQLQKMWNECQEKMKNIVYQL